MAERLGHVLYVIGMAAAFLLAIGAVWIIWETGDHRPGFIAFVSIPALVAWGLGAAARYVLAGS
jgi:hypothetical protein